jgi:DNA-binding CsgD family transcriptional regulator
MADERRGCTAGEWLADERHLGRRPKMAGALCVDACRRGAVPLGKPLLETLERMGYGGVLLDTSGEVLRINTAAMQILQENAPGGDRRNGSDWRHALKSLLHADSTVRLTIEDKPWVVVRRDAAGTRPLVLHAVPVAEGAASGPHTVVILVDLDATPRPLPDALQKIFKLTSAEARLAIEIASGKGLPEIADDHHTAITTVRKQLASVFAKTYTHRQAELVALLARVSILP